MKIKNNQIIRLDKDKFMRLRLSVGLSKKELAIQLGLSISMIFKFENLDNPVITSETLFKYCDFFEITILELLSDDYAKTYASILASYLEVQDIIDPNIALAICGFYKTKKIPLKEKIAVGFNEEQSSALSAINELIVLQEKQLI